MEETTEEIMRATKILLLVGETTTAKIMRATKILSVFIAKRRGTASQIIWESADRAENQTTIPKATMIQVMWDLV